nr:helix-turn-helix domain-containing protein [Sporolactobacillus terrae]
MKKSGKWDEVAANRFQLIAPLLSEDLDAAKVAEMKKQICEKSGLSDRTIRRYLASYRSNGFEGLKPNKKAVNQEKNLNGDLLEQAILLRREAPHRSVRQIIQILEWEGKAKPGEIKRSTLQERLTARGYSSRQMRLYQSTAGAVRRFQKSHRNKLWQSDISLFLASIL